VPDRVLRAIDAPTIDHRGPEFAALGKSVLAGMKKVFKTDGAVVIYPASGTGAWEAAAGQHALPRRSRADGRDRAFRGVVEQARPAPGTRRRIPAGRLAAWRIPSEIEARLTADPQHAIKAVCIVHNETSTGVTSRVADVRGAIDRARHPALFMVDTISSLASIDYRHDEWRVDVTVAGSQKGLMLPPGLSFNAISAKALAAAKTSKLPRSYWDWGEMLAVNPGGFFPYTPATNLLYGLAAALEMLFAEGLEQVFARHDRLAEATRRAIDAWGLEILCADPALYSSTLTAS
jgi:alanine-glyoxylate transaminase/serine-glyoxylate transaminase/serine-pyruvate transaminase